MDRPQPQILYQYSVNLKSAQVEMERIHQLWSSEDGLRTAANPGEGGDGDNEGD
jgi:hypothetical protein